jgi:hypothetical protein
MLHEQFRRPTAAGLMSVSYVTLREGREECPLDGLTLVLDEHVAGTQPRRGGRLRQWPLLGAWVWLSGQDEWGWKSRFVQRTSLLE